MSDRIPYLANRTPEDWNARLTALMDVGLTYADAADWANDDLATTPIEIAEIAREFLNLGLTAHQALPWRRALYDPESAARWARHGWTPSLVDRFVSLYMSQLPLSGVRTPEQMHWADTGLPPERAILYLRAGCSPTEALAFESRRAEGEDIDTTLRFLAAMRS